MAQLPGATQRPITAPKGRRAMRRPVRVNLHVAVSEAKSLHGYFNQTGIPDSHFYTRKDGTTEQMVDTSMRAFADLEGNPDTISIETQGGLHNTETEPWTAAQCEELARIIAWAHNVHDIPLVLARDSKPGKSSHGVSWHRLGVTGSFPDYPLWGRRVGGLKYSNSVGKICPGSAKIKQIPGILARAKQLAGQGGGDAGVSAPASSAGVERAQELLADLGYLDTEKWLIDGVLGDATRQIVRTYQTDHGLVADGVPGPITIKHLEDTVSKIHDDLNKIKAAIERIERKGERNEAIATENQKRITVTREVAKTLGSDSPKIKAAIERIERNTEEDA